MRTTWATYTLEHTRRVISSYIRVFPIALWHSSIRCRPIKTAWNILDITLRLGIATEEPSLWGRWILPTNIQDPSASSDGSVAIVHHTSEGSGQRCRGTTNISGPLGPGPTWTTLDWPGQPWTAHLYIVLQIQLSTFNSDLCIFFQPPSSQHVLQFFFGFFCFVKTFIFHSYTETIIVDHFC